MLQRFESWSSFPRQRCQALLRPPLVALICVALLLSLSGGLALAEAINAPAAAPAKAPSANLVSNGDFESNTGVGQVPNVKTLSNWTVGATTDGATYPYVFVVDTTADDVPTGGFPSPYSPPNLFVWGPDNGISNGFKGSGNGGYFLGVDGAYATAAVSQTISGLTIGQEYTLSFEWAGSQLNNIEGATTQRWAVTFGSDSVLTTDQSVASKGFVGWLTYSHTFMATSTSQTLTFLAVGGPADTDPFLLLDGVVLQVYTPTAVSVSGMEASVTRSPFAPWAVAPAAVLCGLALVARRRRTAR